MVNRDRMVEQLVLHEGLQTDVYIDTEGNETVGVGYNVTARGWDVFENLAGREIDNDTVTEAEALKVLRYDIDRTEAAVRVHFPEYDRLSEVRQRVCVDMAFNMGFKALSFKQTIAAVKRGDWSTAVRELYKSRWAYQVDDGPGKKFGRADRLGQMLLTNIDYVR